MGTITFLGEAVIALCAGGYRALIAPSRGGTALSLTHSPTGANLLRPPAARAAWLSPSAFYGIPLLFPPNRIAGGTFTRNGVRYDMPRNSRDGEHYIHGIIRHASWQVVSCTDSAVTLRLALDASFPMYAYFPHPCTFTVRYALSETGLSQEVACVNQGQTPMPFGFGQHTALCVPFLPGSTAEDVRLLLPIDGRWELDDRMLPTEVLLPLTQEEQAFRTEGLPPLARAYATTHYRLAPTAPGAAREVILRDLGAGYEVVYTLDAAYPHLVLWNDGAAHGYVCPEPMTWMIDAPNRTLPDAITGYRELLPGERVTLTTQLALRATIL